jgi:hypothetical protein
MSSTKEQRTKDNPNIRTTTNDITIELGVPRLTCHLHLKTILSSLVHRIYHTPSTDTSSALYSYVKVLHRYHV